MAPSRGTKDKSEERREETMKKRMEKAKKNALAGSSFEERLQCGVQLSMDLAGDKCTAAAERSLGKLAAQITEKEARKRFKAGLRQSLLFKKVKDELAEALFAVAIPVFVRKGEVICERGCVGQIMFVVIRGGAKAVKKTNANANKSKKDVEESMNKLVGDITKGFETGKTMDDVDDLDMEYFEAEDIMPNEHEETFSSDARSKLSGSLKTEPAASSAVEAIEDKDYGRGSGYSIPIIGRQNPSRYLSAGRVIGSHCVLLNVPHSWKLTATKDTLLFGIHRLQFQEMSIRLSQRNRILESVDRRIEWLQRFSYFNVLPDDQLNWLAGRIMHKRFAAGETIVHAGTPLNGVFIVLRGTVAYLRPKKFEMEYVSKEEQKMVERETSLHEDLNQIAWFTQGDGFGGCTFLYARQELEDKTSNFGVDVVAGNHDDVELLYLDWNEISPHKKVGDRLPLSVALDVAEGYINDIIQASPLFSALSFDDISSLVENIEVEHFNDGETILERGSKVSQNIFVVLSGIVCLEGQLYDRGQSLIHRTKVRSSSNKSSIRAKSSTFTSRRSVVQEIEISRTSSNVVRPSRKLLQRGISQEAFATDSIDHSMEEDSLLEGKTPYVLLVEGETFGEESIEFESAIQSLSCSAVGSVVCARIPLDTLRELMVLDRIRHVYYGTNLLPQVPVEEGMSAEEMLKRKRAQLVKAPLTVASSSKLEFLESFSMSTTFLLLHEMLEFGKRADGSFQANRRSLAGTINLNTLKVLDRLHETSSSKVYLALHEPTTQLCVVKSTNVSKANQHGMGRYAFTEQIILSQVDSPFVIRLLNSWEEKPATIYVALEPVLGGKLDSYILARKKTPERCGPLGCLEFGELRFLAACIVIALKHLSESNICHRDLKTVNIMVDHHGFAKLADFGISKQLQHRSSRTSTFVGTPKYMAPELAALSSGRSSGYGIGVDWWAFGCVLYKMATGKVPFEELGRKERIDEIMATILSFGDRHKVVGQENVEDVLARRNDPVLHCINSEFLDAIPGSTTCWHHFASLTVALLNPNSFFRLGGNIAGPRTALQHPFFGEHHALGLPAIDWDALMDRKLRPVLVPSQKDLIVDMNVLKRIAAGRASIERDVRRISQASNLSGANNSGARLGLAKASKAMNNLSVKTFHSESSEVEFEALTLGSESFDENISLSRPLLIGVAKGNSESGLSEDHVEDTVENILREKLEMDCAGFLGSTLVRKRVMRQQNMLSNHRRAKILELKRTAKINGSLAPQTLRRAVVAETMHQIVLSSFDRTIGVMEEVPEEDQVDLSDCL